MKIVLAIVAAAALAGSVLDRHGPIDILVANAGLPAAGQLSDFTPEQLQRALQQAIARGQLGAEDALPPERQLAAALGISRITVRKASWSRRS